MSTATPTELLKKKAHALGFQLAGICPAVSPDGFKRIDAWLASGYAGQMHYIADRRDAYEHPRHVLDGVQSVVMLAMNYHVGEPAELAPASGRVSRYAWGAVDYHDLIRERLHAAADYLREIVPGARTRGVVDTAPLLEREFASLAGLGWVGKNTLLLNREAGSWFFLSALLTDAALDYDDPHTADHCGTCRACLDACPTDAFPSPYVLDASRCISYLTIELRESMPVDLRTGVGDWLFGCDICQDVCPWNRDAPESTEPAFAPTDDMNTIDLAGLFDLDEAAFRARFRHTPLWRPRRRGILRNAAIVLGNRRSPTGLTALVRGLKDEEPLVRTACAWALGRYEEAEAKEALAARHLVEADAEVLQEIQTALK